MAKPMGTGSIVQVSFLGGIDGQRTLNILHYKRTDPGASVDWNNIEQQFHGLLVGTGGLVDAYLACCSNEYTLQGIVYQLLSPTRHALRLYPLLGGTGTISTPALPSFVAASLTKQNDDTGPHNRGGIRMPGVPTTFVADSSLTSLAITAYNALGMQLAMPRVIDNTPAPPVVLSPCIYDRMAPSASALYSTARPELTARTSRRRVVGLGE